MKRVLNYLGKAMTIIALAYIVYYIYRIDFDVNLIKSWPTFIVVALLGGILLAGCVFCMGALWGGIIKAFSKQSVQMNTALKVYAKANIGKYLPGNVMHYVERNLFAANAGMGQAEITMSTILEIGLEICTAGIIAIIFLGEHIAFIVGELFSPLWLIVIIALLMIVVCVAVILFRLNSKFRDIIVRLFSKNILIASLKNMFFYGLIFAIMGLIMVAILKYPLGCELSTQVCGYVIASYIMAWVIGFVVPGAPGGIGVREFVLITLLGAYLSEEYIVIAMILHRLLNVAGDFLAYLISSVGMKNALEEQ